jgi:hypothetical protein
VLMKKTQTEPSALEDAIDNLLSEMKSTDPISDEYGKLVERLDKLHKMKVAEKDNRKRVSADTIVTVGANLAGIVLILGFERAHIVTSKALGFVLKSKV